MASPCDAISHKKVVSQQCARLLVCGSSLAQEKNGKRPGCIDVNHFRKISAVLPKNNHHKTSFLDIYVADDGATENSFIFV